MAKQPQRKIDIDDLHRIRKTFPSPARTSTLRRIALMFPDTDDSRDLLRCADVIDATRTALKGTTNDPQTRHWNIQRSTP